jgi:hypothetical protein
MLEWIKALRLHQLDLFRARSSVFEQWLNKQGVKVPGKPAPDFYEQQFIEDAAGDKQVQEVLMPETRKEE